MKKLNLTFIFCLTVFFLSAQDIKIDFQPKVAGTPIDSVRATNLRTNQTVKLLGSESLVLVKTPTGINPVLEINETGYIYPNPTDEDATFCFSTNKSEEIEIGMYNTNGQLIKQNRLFLEQGIHRFDVKFPVAGIYFLSVLKSEGTASFKAVSAGSKTQTGSIQYAGSEKPNSQKNFFNQLKSATADITLAYIDGDIIHYSFFSGVNSTIVTDIPAKSKTIDAEFVNCIDSDNKSYKTVKIGNQTWMAENLDYLPSVSPSSAESYTVAFYYVYGYQGTDVAAAKQQPNYITYGVLYNWLAAKNGCPEGWHLPTDAEWTALENYLIANGFNYDGTTTGKKIAKSMAAVTNWTAYSSKGAIGMDLSLNNKSGFSALPGGGRYGDGSFDCVGIYGDWWSSSEYSTSIAGGRGLDYDLSYISGGNNGKDWGFSVRCVRDNTDAPLSVTTSAITITSITQSTAKGGGNVTTDGGATVIARGVCWNTTGNPTTSDSKTNNGTGTGSYESYLTDLTAKTSYYVRSYATNSKGTVYGNEFTFTTSSEGNLTDTFKDSRDGHVYKTVKIGNQTWMAENLAYLPAVSPSSAGSSISPFYYVYDYQGTNVATAKNTANYKTYGVLYNWPAAKAACPPGWHLPSDADWNALENYLIANGFNYDGTTTENKIAKSVAATTHWKTYWVTGAIGKNLSLNNKSGFSALPGGSRVVYGEFYGIGDKGVWWSPEASTYEAWLRALGYDNSRVTRGSNYKEVGFSVRCVRD
jgi:uncharacterized protein (TIGR02145 family)